MCYVFRQGDPRRPVFALRYVAYGVFPSTDDPRRGLRAASFSFGNGVFSVEAIRGGPSPSCPALCAACFPRRTIRGGVSGSRRAPCALCAGGVLARPRRFPDAGPRFFFRTARLCGIRCKRIGRAQEDVGKAFFDVAFKAQAENKKPKPSRRTAPFRANARAYDIYIC